MPEFRFALVELAPSPRNAAGYRLYTPADVARLQQIVSLRQLGLSLAEIRDCLANPAFSLPRTLRLHLAHLTEQIVAQQQLRTRLQTLVEHVESAETVSVAELTQTIEAIIMFDKYYTPAQLEQLAARREEVGETRIREVEAEWPQLMAEVRSAMERGAPPESERVQQLARRWHALVREFTGGDPGIEGSLRNLYQNESTVAGVETGPMREIAEYIGRAAAAAQARG